MRSTTKVSARAAIVTLISGFVLTSFFIAVVWAIGRYYVYQAGLVGEAELRRAEQNRQITVQEAQAKFESAKMLAQAEVERARGVAEANRIIGKSLEGGDNYLRYLWLQGLQDGGNSVIYVPTEANLPILEAGKRP
jgi:regulator of protease activity HflC (stomatin/prohibitin superfamily)